MPPITQSHTLYKEHHCLGSSEVSTISEANKVRKILPEAATTKGRTRVSVEQQSQRRQIKNIMHINSYQWPMVPRIDILGDPRTLGVQRESTNYRQDIPWDVECLVEPEPPGDEKPTATGGKISRLPLSRKIPLRSRRILLSIALSNRSITA